MKKRYYSYFMKIILVFMIFGFVLTSLLDFNRAMQAMEYQLELDAMARVASQGSLVLETKLSGYLKKLSAMAEFFQEGELHTEKNMEILRNISNEMQQDFQRFALADLEGNSWVTNGSRLDVSEQPYFKNALEKKYTITDNKHSQVIENNHIFIISVPILDGKDQVRGVLYGVVEVDKFQLHQDMDGEEQKYRVVDRNGDYILRGNPDFFHFDSNNLFENISNINMSQSIDQVKARIQKGEAFLDEFSRDGINYVIYFSPLKINDWYSITVMKQSQILDYIRKMSGKDIYIIMAKVMAAVALLCGTIILFLMKEKKDALSMYHQMKVNDEMLRAAIGKSDALILIYDLKTRQLRCLNPECVEELSLPEIIENAPEQILQFLPEGENSKRQIQDLFASLEEIRGTQVFQLVFEDGEKRYHYQIRISALLDDENKVFQCVGLAENITEQLVMRQEIEIFRQKAGTDYLTGLYNRGKGTELITELLNNMDPETESHAFIILDLDNFKGLNDTLGHQTGDAALQDVASILQRHFRNYDIICRLAGDEFVVLINNIPEEIVQKNLEILLKKLNLSYGQEKTVQISASIGVAMAARDGRDFQTLYQKADEALYEAKKSGKQTAVIYGKK